MNIIKRSIHEIKCIVKANDIILNHPEHSADMNRVNLHYYHADWHDGINSNLGDYLSEVVVKWMCERNGIDYYQPISETHHLYAIGSILQMGYQNATVWGTGFAFELDGVRAYIQKMRKLDVKCVRGPKTKKTLERLGFQCPDIYGDPGVLLPLIYAPEKSQECDYVIIPHFSVEEQTKRIYGQDRVLSMNTTDYRGVINQICSAKKVISSSLHGIILAEAYGIPAIFYQDRHKKFNYKYEDWYQSTGRSLNHICISNSRPNYN